MKYSFNREKEGIVFAHAKDINASFKDLSAVCDAIRYKNAQTAMSILDSVSQGGVPILYRKYNKYMGSRHELGGRKGRYPIKCTKIVRKVLVNAMANAEGKGESPSDMYIVHAAANKTNIFQRVAPKGELRVGHVQGRGSTRRTDLELAKLELALGYGEERGLSERMRKIIGKEKKQVEAAEAKSKPKQKVKKEKKSQATPKPPAPVKEKAAEHEAKAKGQPEQENKRMN
ncbi:MAG: hypothetical protein M1528_02035 [Candidatus Marsarchaeota archaeon]|jgi:ribosomal protein L22|nr:hypothetical protein [Candidatus Marsarchaeota archaeon]MCL5115288.1 hypothetical protein [Candidatus Marsarchaeota archaeon]